MTLTESELRRALQQFVDTIEMTGGLTDGSLGPKFAPKWLDLGLAYQRAKSVLRETSETAPLTPSTLRSA